MVRVALTVCVAALVCAGSSAAARAGGPSTYPVTITGAGGVQLDCTYVVPAGTAPDGGWPGLVLFPGLDGAPTPAIAFATTGFASVSCAERGTGASGGAFDLGGTADAQDAQAIFDWLAARPEVSDTQIGAEGEDLGGAEVWDAAAAGVPFKAIVPADAWSSLNRALTPTGVLDAKLFQLFAAEGPTTFWDNPPAIAARSYRGHLHALTVPTLIVHDREDALVDLSQATAAYSLLHGPKRLYIAQSSALPEDQVIAWFERYLASGPPAGKGVVLQHAQPDTATTTYRAPPPTRSVSVNLPGAALKRSVRLPGGPLESFGGGSVTIRYTSASWQQVVATVSTAHGAVVTEGAAPVKKSAGVLKIPLLNEVALLPRGKKLVVTLASHDATFGGTTSGTIAVGRVTLKLSVLARAVSH